MQLAVASGLAWDNTVRFLASAALLALLLPLLPVVATEQIAGWQPYYGHIQLKAHDHVHRHPYEAVGGGESSSDTRTTDSASVAFTITADGNAAGGLSLALPTAAPSAISTELAPPHAMPAVGHNGLNEWQTRVPTEPPPTLTHRARTLHWEHASTRLSTKYLLHERG